MEQFHQLYKAGEVFGKKREVQKSFKVYSAANQLAEELGKDIVRHVKTMKLLADEPDNENSRFINDEFPGHYRYEILFNLVILIFQRVNPYYCGVGAYDSVEGTCSYLGITRC